MSRTCLKFSIVLINVLVMLTGAAAVGVGVWVLVNDQDFFDESTDVLDLDILGADLLDNVAMTMITAGAVVFVIGTMGCVGAFALSSFILVFYSLCLTVLLTIQVAVVVLAIVFRSELLDKADDKVKDRLLTEYGDDTKSFTESFNILQKELDCCGWESGDDYQNTTLTWQTSETAGNPLMVVPISCCSSSNQTLLSSCSLEPNSSSIYNNKGCKDEVKDKLERYVWVIIGITGGLLGFQFLLIVLALCLVVKNAGKKYNM